MKHLAYLRYVLRHKWFVYQEGRRLGVPRWQLLVHDWSKFLPDEWLPYAEWFYGLNGGSWDAAPDMLDRRPEGGDWVPHPRKAPRAARFDAAWLKHQHRSPHHWQYWVLHEDNGGTKVLPMPDKYRREMLADWRGAGRAIHGDRSDTAMWYLATVGGRMLHPETQDWVERELGVEA